VWFVASEHQGAQDRGALDAEVDAGLPAEAQATGPARTAGLDRGDVDVALLDVLDQVDLGGDGAGGRDLGDPGFGQLLVRQCGRADGLDVAAIGSVPGLQVGAGDSAGVGQGVGQPGVAGLQRADARGVVGGGRLGDLEGPSIRGLIVTDAGQGCNQPRPAGRQHG
jgi:hypothetical protein